MPKPQKPKSLQFNNTKAGRLPSTGKKRRPAAEAGEGGSGSNGGGSGGRPKKAKKSFLGMLVTGAGFAALWAYNVYARVQQGQADRRTLDAMLRKPLGVTQHAACRMDCRFIGRPEIEETLRTGRINSRKSQPTLRPCPKYTVDAIAGPARKNVQGVFAACPAETRVITVIDTDTNWACGPC